MLGEHLSKEASMEDTDHEGTTEVVAREVRRRHMIAYMLKVLETVAALRAEGNGAIGAISRHVNMALASSPSFPRGPLYRLTQTSYMLSTWL